MSDTRTLYIIRENISKTYCSSSRHATFVDDLGFAAIFMQKENAEKAIRDMVRGLDPKHTTWPYWSLRGERHRGREDAPGHVNGYVTPLLVPDFEAVPCTLTLDS